MLTRNKTSVERLHDDLESFQRFYLGNALNASSGSEMTSRKNKNRMDEILRMWRSFVGKKVFVEDERKSVSDL